MYLLLCADGVPHEYRPHGCPHCHAKVMLHRHGKFTRWIFTLTGAQRVPIFRFLCPLCSKAISLLPSFIETHHQASTEIKEDLMQQRAEGTTQSQLSMRSQQYPGGPWSEKSVGRWIRRWNERLNQNKQRFWTWGLHHYHHEPLPKERESDWRSLFTWWAKIRKRMSGVSVLQPLLHVERSMEMTANELHPTKAVRRS